MSFNNHLPRSLSSLFEVLEERVLFDGVPDATFILPQTDAPDPVAAQVQDIHQAAIGGARELILVDPGVEDSASLLSSILDGKPESAFEVRILDANRDGIRQISELLAGAEGEYEAIHIISHGSEGEVQLGNTALTADNLNRYSDQLAGWADALTDDADLLFYGCDLAGNDQGQLLIESISSLTGADVAASADLTGSAELGGNWDLEFQTGVIETATFSADGYSRVLALADATLSITSDGTPTWDADNNAGNDTDGSNGIIRSHDSLLMEVFYNTDANGATDLRFTSTLPDGLVFDFLPASAALDPRSMIVDSVTGLPGGDMRTIIAYLPDVAGTFTSSVNFEARALGGAQGTPLDDVFFEVNSNENPAPIVTEAFDFTLSSAAHMDIQLLSPTFRGVFTDATGAQEGVVYTYGIGILGDHPTRTGTDGVKGSAPIEDNFTFDLDFTNVAPGATIFDWGASLGNTSDNADDGITRNYERFVNAAGTTETVWSQSSRPAGQTDEAGTAVWSADRSTPDSGDWTITGSSGSVFSAQVSGADTTGPHFPSNYGGGGVIPAGDKWFTSAQVSVWIPIDEILPGQDGISGTADDGVLQITPEITNFDPDDAFGITNNFGAGTEDTSNNEYTHTIFAFNQGGGTKHNAEAGHPTSGRWVETASNWNAGDAETSVGHIYDARVSSGRNQGVLALEGAIFGDKFDNTATKITANSLQSASGDGWSRVYASGGPNSGTHLTYGTDYIIEFGTGGVGGAAGGWTDWDSMGDATLADGESSGGYWSEDPTDVLLGGNAYADGVRDSITKWRVVLLRDLEPGEVLFALVTMETVGHSTLDPANNPGGNIIANFQASSIGYLRDDANPDNDWRTSEYDPLTNSVYSGAASGISSGDRLWIVDANVDVDKTVIDLGAGNNFLAGSAATIQLEGTVTIPGPDNGSPAEDVYITDMLPAGLTVVGGSAQPTAGTTFTAGDGSTISVQAVEYYDPATSSWSTTWTYGSTGIRWFFGDVPLNTTLPTMTFDVLVPFDAQNGESWTNTAVASSPSDDTTEEFRSSSAGLVAVQVAALSAGKQVVTPLVAEDTLIVYELGVANVSDDKDVNWFDLVDLLPYDADFEGSSFNGVYTDIGVTGLDPGLEVYVTTVAPQTLDAADGTVDGFADPGTAAAGDAWFVAEGTGIWTYTLADVENGVAGAPAMGDITAIRVVSDKSIDPYLDPGESTKFFLELMPDGNVGIPSDHYTNKFTARTDPGQLPLPVTSAPVTAVVVAPDIEIEKEVALDETHVNIDGTDDSHWGETVNFDDTDKAFFRIKVTNTGTADLLGATVNDTLPAGATLVGGTVSSSAGDTSGFPATWTFDIAAGDSAWLIYQIDVNDEGLYINEADVTATDAWGETVVDSDVAEANFVTEISAAKQQIGAVRSTTNPDWFEVTYEAEVLNSSIFDLADITLTEDLVGAFGAGFTGILTAPAISSSSLSAGAIPPTLNSGYDGSSDDQILNADGLLKPGDSVTIQYTVYVDPALLADPANTVNQVEAGGVTGGPGGTPTTDLSDDGSDPASDNPGTRGDDGMGGTDDPTPLALPSIDLTKEVVGFTPAGSGINGNFDVTYEFTISNDGTVNLDNINVVEDFLANLGGAFQGIVSGPLVTMTTATDNPDFNTPYDGGTSDSNVFETAPTQTMFTFGGSNTSTTIDRTQVFGDQQFVIDPNQTYTLMADAFAGDGAGGNYDPASANFVGFASYDIDGNLITVYNYAKETGAVDTTLAAPLNPGDTTITLNDATGWYDGTTAHRRSIAWYGYTDSTGFTYPDYTYTRNFESVAWDAGAISGNTITLSAPWAGPALNAGDAVRNNKSGGTYQYVLVSNSHIDETGGTYTSDIGGGVIPNGAAGTTLWRPGTHSISPLILADWQSGGTGTQLNVSNFKIDAANTSLIEPGQKVTFQITVEVDPDAPGALYDEITGDGNNTLENQAGVTAEDPFNGIPVADTSDDPTDPTDAEYGDDSDPDDPTSLAIPSIELIKDLVGVPVAASSGNFGNFDATYEFTLTNNGNDDLMMLSLVEDFATQFGSAFVNVVSQGGAAAVVTTSTATDTVEINANYNGSSDTEIFDNSGGNTNLLEMGQSITIQVVVEVDPDAAGANYINGQLLNIAMTAGTGTESGIRVDDQSDDTGDTTDSDPDGDNSPDDPTPLYIPSISLTKSAGDAVANGENWDVTFTKVIKNTGTTTLTNLQLLDDIAAQFGNAYVSASALSVQNFAGSGTAPSANGLWTGDTMLSMLSGGTLERGDSFEVVFTVTIDPDGIDNISQALENTSNVTGDALDNDGNPLLDDSGNPVSVTDDSDNGLDPDSENGEDNMDGTAGNDPTPIVIADISVVKEVFGTPTPVGDNFSVTYQLVIENTGTVTLNNLSLADDLSTQFGAAFVSAGNLTLITAPADAASNVVLDSANWNGDSVDEMIDQAASTSLAVGDFYVVQFDVVVDPDASGTSGPLDNQVMTAGDAVDSNGSPITDSSGNTIVANDDSDSGTNANDSNPGADGDTGGTDDPTPLLLPALAVGKQANSVTIATDGAGNELTGSFDVEYLVVLENTGTIELTNLQLLDDLTTVATFGDAYDPTALTGTADRSGLVVGPAIVSHTLANPADLPILNSGFLGGGAQTNLFDGTSGALQTGEQIVVSFTIRIDSVELTDGDPTDGLAQNQVQGSAESAQGSVNDDSDDGLNPNTDNGDGGTNDPTPFEVPQVRLWKSHSDFSPNPDGTSTITVQLRVQNSGTVTLNNLALVEDLETQFGAALVSVSVPSIVDGPDNPLSNIPASLINGIWNTDTVSQNVFDPAETGESLAAGDEFTIEFEVIVDPDLLDADSDYLTNTATVSGDGTNFNNMTITVSDDSGADNGTGIDSDEPTPAIVPEIAIVKSAGDAVANGANWDVTFTLVVENTGSVNLSDLTLLDDIDSQFGDAFVSVTGLMVQNFAGAGVAPTANTAWESNTMANLLAGGNLDPGDRFEVTYTVTIDPDGIDSVSQALENTATVTGDAVDQLGNPLLDESGDPLTANDVSDDGTSPQGTNPGENGDTGTDSDPTPIIIADVSIAKAVVGQPTLLSNGNFEVTYQLVVENIGTVHLNDMTLIDDLETQFGSSVFQQVSDLALVTGPTDSTSNILLDGINWDGTAATDMLDQSISNTLAIGDIFTLQFKVEVDGAAATGVLDNQATVAGTGVDDSGMPYLDSSGNEITAEDDSDSGTMTADDNTGEPGDTGGTDDPTPLYLPDIGLAKQAGDAVANGDNFDVEFTLVWENTGNVDLNNLMMFDNIASQFGNAFVSVSGLTVQNFTGTGTAPTANPAWLSDTALTMITGGMGNVGDTFEVVFTVTIDPDGIDNVSQALNNQAMTSGDALDENGQPLLEDSGSQITVNDDSDNGLDTNGENGEDNGDDVFGNDPTPVIIADVSVAKSVFGQPVELNNGNFEVTYRLVIENTGTVDLANLSLVENLQGHFGPAFQNAYGLTLATDASDPASNIVLDSAAWNGDTTIEMIDQTAMTLLVVGDSFVVTFQVEVDPDAVGAPATLENQVTVSGAAVDSAGNPINDSTGSPIATTDDSDDGTDPNNDNPAAQGDDGAGGTDDPTPLLIPDIAVAKQAGDAVANGENWDVTFTLVVENIGTVSLDMLTLEDDIASQFGNAYVSASGLAIQNFTGTGTAPGANGSWGGNTMLDMLDGTGTLNVGDSFEVVFTVTIDPDGIDDLAQALENQASVGGNGINPDGTAMTDESGNPVTTDDHSDNGADVHGENGEDDMDGIAGNDPTPVIIADVSVVKEAVGLPTRLANGNFEVTYELVIENTGTVDLAGLTLTEDLANQYGAVYVDAHSLVLVTPPVDPASSIVLDSANWNGGSAPEMIDQSAMTLLAVGDSFVVQFTVEVDPSQATTDLTNQVTVGGSAVDANGDPLNDGSGSPITATDDSDSGSDPNGDNPDAPGENGTTDDPTPLYIPDIGLAKQAGDAIANGENWDVTFTLVWENTGTVALDNVEIFDDIAAEFGSQFVSISGLAIQNFAGTGSAPTANAAWNTGDTTTSLITSTGPLEIGDTFEVVFTVAIDPDAAGVSSGGLENQATSTGAGLDENGNPLLDDSGAPVTVTDDSDNGVNPNDENGSVDTPDGHYANDPTPIVIADLGIAKTLVGDPVLTDFGNYIATYQLVVENTGTVDLANLSLLEDLATQFGSPFVDAGNLILVTAPGDAASSIVLDSANWNGSSVIELVDAAAATMLVVGDSFTIQFDVEIDPNLVTDTLENQVSGQGNAVDHNGDLILDSNGDPIIADDLSDSGTDPGSVNSGAPGDQSTTSDASPFTPPPVPLGEISGTVFVDANNDGILNPGEDGIEGVEITLTGTDVNGNPVTATVFTDADGRYVFDNLPAGNYSIAQVQPEGFADGLENGNSEWTIGDDVMSNIELGWGETFGTSTFGERLPGASGNPPSLPGFLPFARSPISRFLNQFTGTPGLIYSGNPVASSANPLTFESGRPISGGYSSAGTHEQSPGDPCCEPVDPCSQIVAPPVTDACGNPIIVMPQEAIIDDGCGCGPVPSSGLLMQESHGIEEPVPADAESVVESVEADPANRGEENDMLIEQGISDRPSFLKRFSSWLTISNNVGS